MEPENKSNSTLVVIVVVVILVVLGLYVWQNMDGETAIPVEESASELDTLEQELNLEGGELDLGIENLE